MILEIQYSAIPSNNEEIIVDMPTIEIGNSSFLYFNNILERIPSNILSKRYRKHTHSNKDDLLTYICEDIKKHYPDELNIEIKLIETYKSPFFYHNTIN